MIVFGPIPSRRLGRSLGVNNLPSKHCSYSCVYCQCGPTPRTGIVRQEFYPVEAIVDAVAARIAECQREGIAVDFISFVPDGEPTLDRNLGTEIREVKRFGIPVAVITNGSLLWMRDVRDDLAEADLVSIEIDSLTERAWRSIDRPSPDLSLALVKDGIKAFASGYRGKLFTQTMLVAGINDSRHDVEEIADLVASLRPERAFLAIPTRPPADSRVRPPSEEAIVAAWVAYSSRVPHVELLRGHETAKFAAAGDAIDQLLAMLAVHPMRQEAVDAYLRDAGLAPAVLEEPPLAGRLARVDYGDSTFVIRER